MTSFQPVFIPENKIVSLIDWNVTYEAVEASLKSVSTKRATQNPRGILRIPGTNNALYSMPGYVDDVKFGALACKLVTNFPGNESSDVGNIASVNANILLFDDRTGVLKAVIGGSLITAYRTAVASVVAANHLLKTSPEKLRGKLAILGAGTQGIIHAKAFSNFFQFEEIRVWNRTTTKATKLCEELEEKNPNCKYLPFNTVEECVFDADVIITTTNAEEPILFSKYIKAGTLIIAVGVSAKSPSEIDIDTYKSANIYVDSLEGAENELVLLKDFGIQPNGEIGDVIAGNLVPCNYKITVFQSLGIAAEDCVMARLIYDKWIARSNTT